MNFEVPCEKSKIIKIAVSTIHIEADVHQAMIDRLVVVISEVVKKFLSKNGDESRSKVPVLTANIGASFMELTKVALYMNLTLIKQSILLIQQFIFSEKAFCHTHGEIIQQYTCAIHNNNTSSTQTSLT